MYRVLSSVSLSSRDVRTLVRCCHIRGLRLTRDGELLVMEGQVPCYGVKKLAAVAAARLLGAPRVVNRLRVVPQGRQRDAELVEALRVALRSRYVLRGAGVGAGSVRGKRRQASVAAVIRPKPLMPGRPDGNGLRSIA